MDAIGNEVECPLCAGRGCEQCAEGYFEVPGCPQDYIRPLFASIRLADLFEKGLLPVAGGVLDQAASFVEFAAAWKNEQYLASRDDG